MNEYKQQVVALTQLAGCCNHHAQEGWRLHTALPAMAQVEGAIVTPTSGGTVQVALLLFERQVKVATANNVKARGKVLAP